GALGEAVVGAGVGRHDFPIPDTLVQRDVAHRIGRMQASLSRQGVDPAKLDWDYAKLAGDLRPAAERAVRWALLQEAVAEREELTGIEGDGGAGGGGVGRGAGRPAQGVGGGPQA